MSINSVASPLQQTGAGSGKPAHVAIIMDGNGRWARARGLPRAAGHRAGAQAVRRAVEAAIGCGVEWLTIYAFSSENWRRPPEEVLDLTGLLRRYLRQELAEMSREGVRLRVLGNPQRFDGDLQSELAQAEQSTRGNSRLNLNIALSYGSRDEIVAAAKAIAAAAAAGSLKPGELDEARFANFLFTAEMPDPDMVIRTSGEHRLSNFLLWQSAYAELVFLDVLWPDFCRADFEFALAEFARRERRFGG
ncbi:MAG: polyprenyl diphosphate synthase [Acetobacteraceae bacterium]|nr:polyprenyl diphosphate synthase [Acetobacteraceae bacterium]